MTTLTGNTMISARLADSLQDAILLDHCPVCAADISRWRGKQTPYGHFSIDRCGGCGLAFVNPRPSLKFLGEYYATIGASNHPGASGVSLEWVLAEEARFPNASVDAAEMMTRILAHLRARVQTPTLLDVGCGYGFFSREAQRHGFQVHAIELGPAREVARAMTGLEPQPALFEQFAAPPGSFSVILMSQVLEHVQDVNLWTRRAYELLQPGGVLAIALPHFGSAIRRLLGARDPFITPPEHLNFFTGESLRLLLLRHGFLPGTVEYRSRVPPRAIERRLGALGRPITRLAHSVANGAAAWMDRVDLGMMVRIYGTKPLDPV